MTELVVISGKGGTGKTSLAAAFAVLSQPTVVADCDVDAADLALLLAPVAETAEPFYGRAVPTLDSHQCTGCGACFGACRFEAITFNRDDEGAPLYAVDELACEGCGVCAAVCPVNAITMHDHRGGEIYSATSRVGPMVHARLGIAEENSGKLAALVRTRAKALAQQHGLEQLIVDGPPGAGCPVIASITGATCVCVVTEPTVSGLHDFERVAQLARHCRTPAIAIVNKFDLNRDVTRAIESFCRTHAVACAGHILYSRAVTQAMLAGRTLADEPRGTLFQQVAAVWKQVQAFLRACSPP
jgi:MinD superfamily P-loop ATPase